MTYANSGVHGACLDRLKTHQRNLILQAAERDAIPAGSTLERIAELENAIVAVEAVAGDEAKRARSA
ncbi:hypothetical protein [Methylobacterium iners]|uniref:hypothetical protein n=1 Tax=Methylobacterium iners TaxID=418707 RepID=UPI001EE2D67A|nr:hypothetical protein [Methylobacterium iners]